MTYVSSVGYTVHHNREEKTIASSQLPFHALVIIQLAPHDFSKLYDYMTPKSTKDPH